MSVVVVALAYRKMVVVVVVVVSIPVLIISILVITIPIISILIISILIISIQDINQTVLILQLYSWIKRHTNTRTKNFKIKCQYTTCKLPIYIIVPEQLLKIS